MRKLHKRTVKKRRVILSSILLLLMVLSLGPFLWSIMRLKNAENHYNVSEVKTILESYDEQGWISNNIGWIKDARLWLGMNLGDQDLTSKLTQYQDDRHRFWLFLLDVQKGDISAAQIILDSLNSSSQHQLGLGIMSLASGNSEESKRLLTDPETEWNKLSSHDQALRYLTLAQVAMAVGDQTTAHSELTAAEKIEPNNPACQSLNFDLAIIDGQRAKALELSKVIDGQTWRPKNKLYETKMAVLAIGDNDEQRLANSLLTLKELPQGNLYIDYVKGILAIKKGQLQEGKTLLEGAIKNGLDGGIKTDAQLALDQIKERLDAEQTLQSVQVSQ